MGFCSSLGINHKVMETFCVNSKENIMIDYKNNKQVVVVETNKKLIKGRVLLMKKNVLAFKDVKASLLDRIYELFGKGVSMQIISSVQPDPEHGVRGKLGKVAYLEKWITTISPMTLGET